MEKKFNVGEKWMTAPAGIMSSRFKSLAILGWR
jgi:hypothetical protein